MAQGDILKRYLDAGVAFTQLTRERAEAIVQDLVENGEIRRKEAQKRIEELVERSQKNTEELLGMIRREVAEQLKNLGLEDLAKRAGMGGEAAATPSSTPAIKKTAKKAPAGVKKSTATSTAKKVPAAKKGAAKKAGGAKKA